MSEEEIIKKAEYIIKNGKAYQGSITEYFVELYYLFNKEKEKKEELEKIVETYNVMPNKYTPNNMKLVIADMEYFKDGFFKENMIPKSKIKAKIEELQEEYNNMRQTSDFIIADVLQPQIRVLEELLEDK